MSRAAVFDLDDTPTSGDALPDHIVASLCDLPHIIDRVNADQA
jgi:hypothetical protein